MRVLLSCVVCVLCALACAVPLSSFRGLLWRGCRQLRSSAALASRLSPTPIRLAAARRGMWTNLPPIQRQGGATLAQQANLGQPSPHSHTRAHSAHFALDASQLSLSSASTSATAIDATLGTSYSGPHSHSSSAGPSPAFGSRQHARQRKLAHQLTAPASAFYLPAPPLAASSAAQSDGSDASTTAGAFHRDQQQAGLTELVRSCALQHPSGGGVGGGGEAMSGSASPLLSHPAPSSLSSAMTFASPSSSSSVHSHAGSLDFGSSSMSMPTGLQTLRSQPPSPVLAAYDDRDRDSSSWRTRMQMHGMGMTQETMAQMDLSASGSDAAVVPAADPSTSPDLQDQSLNDSPSSSSLLHRKIASCPSGLSDLREASSGGSVDSISSGAGAVPWTASQQLEAHLLAMRSGQHLPQQQALPLFPPAGYPPLSRSPFSPSASPPHAPSSPLLSQVGGGGGKLTHSLGSGSLYHPYERPSRQHTPEPSPTSSVHASPPASAVHASPASGHKPTVISRDGARFMSPQRKGPAVPAALASIQSHLLGVAASAGHTPRSSLGSITMPLQLAAPPPLSLHGLSESYGASSTGGGSSSMQQQMMFGGGPSPTGSVASSSSMGGAQGSPPASPNPSHASGTRTPPASAYRSPRGFGFGSHVSVDYTSNAGIGGGGGGSASLASSYSASSSTLLGSGGTAWGAGGGVSSLSSSTFNSPQLRPGSHLALPVAGSSLGADPSNALRLPTPDFHSAFDSSAAHWSRLSNHSPLKHRSLPGTPSLRHRTPQPSVPATPNSKLSKQARSRRTSGSAQEKAQQQIVEAAALLVDFTNLDTSPHSLPLMQPMPIGPTFAEQVRAASCIGSGSYGDVYRVFLDSPQPFGSTPQVAVSPNNFLQAPAMANEPMGPVAAAAAPGLGVPSPLQTYSFALKRQKVAFSSLHERSRMLHKYQMLFEFVQRIRNDAHAAVAASAQAHALDPTVPLATVASVCASMRVDPHNFFPLHLAQCSHVWQEGSKLHVLMRLCSRGEVTTYWSREDSAQTEAVDAAPADEEDEGMGSCTALSSVSTSLTIHRSVGSGLEAEDDDDGTSSTSSDEAVSQAEFAAAVAQFTAAKQEEEAQEADGIAASPLAQSSEHYLSSRRPIPPALLSALESDASAPPLSPLSESLIWRLLCHISSALSLMHHHSFWHLDLKPANIYVDRGDDGIERFVLGDFDSCVLMHSAVAVTNRVQSASQSLAALFPLHPGSSVASSAAPAAGAAPAAPFNADLDALEAGDGLWCAPELLQSMQLASSACDIFSLGSSCYALLTDRLPSKDAHSGGVNLDFSAGVVRCPVSAALQKTLLAMVASNPRDRPSAAQILDMAQSRIAEGSQPTPTAAAAVQRKLEFMGDAAAAAAAAPPNHAPTSAGDSMIA